MKIKHWIIAILVGLIVGTALIFVFSSRNTTPPPDEAGLTGGATGGAPQNSLELSYLYSQAKVGDKVFIGVIADSGGEAIDGVDVFIQIDKKLQVVSYIPTGLLPVKPGTFVTKAGTTSTTVSFSQLANGGAPQAVKGLIAIIETKAITKGSAPLKFAFTLGNTKDTNMAALGADVLTKVVNKTVTVN